MRTAAITTTPASVYHACLRRAGVDPAARPAPLTREVLIAPTDEEALALAEKHLLVSYRDEYGGGRWKHPLIGAPDTAPVDRLDALSCGRFLVGSPPTIVRQLGEFERAFGVDHLICRLYFPGLPHRFILQELELLAAEVMPAFR